jgi:hypothetical protein
MHSWSTALDRLDTSLHRVGSLSRPPSSSQLQLSYARFAKLAHQPGRAWTTVEDAQRDIAKLLSGVGEALELFGCVFFPFFVVVSRLHLSISSISAPAAPDDADAQPEIKEEVKDEDEKPVIEKQENADEYVFSSFSPFSLLSLVADVPAL